MDDFTLEKINGEPNADDKQIMINGMLTYHASKGHIRKTETFSIILRNKSNIVKGMVIVSFLWNGMHIDSLWVDDTVREQKWGSSLLNMVEKEAIKRGCTIAYTDTFTWQAPKFYEKQGYKPYGKLEDFPTGNTLFYYAKNLRQLDQGKT